ncbi:hypothetical protein [Peribacillus simplex]|uniref:hypothetical protein n=1 Tax=Peribacillus simplex TaxID=1478 RepID=UPI0016232B3C|nr:hypothetical protein [Peribacillus simplex]
MLGHFWTLPCPIGHLLYIHCRERYVPVQEAMYGFQRLKNEVTEVIFAALTGAF